MHEELEMIELTDTEMDAVAGGFLNNWSQNNLAFQIPVAVNTGGGGTATARARAFQVNSIIVA
jgi:hypothetical protein